MPLYTYRCKNGHEVDRYFPIKGKPQSIFCDCRQVAKAIINTRMMGSCWAEGKIFPHVSDTPLKSYKQLDQVVAEQGGHVENLSPKQLKAKQEERAHNRLRSSIASRKTTYRTPEIVRQAFKQKSLNKTLQVLKSSGGD